MNLDEAQQVIANLCMSHKTFKPMSEPTLTPRGWSIEIANVSVSPSAVIQWFEKIDVMVILIGINEPYENSGKLLVEFR